MVKSEVTTEQKKSWKPFGSFILIFLAVLAAAVSITVVIDPFFHYHAPLPGLYYKIGDKQRYQNIGIMQHFDYDAVITGTSISMSFKNSELDEMFGTSSVKTSVSGATLHECDLLVREGYAAGHQIRLVLRSLDVNHLCEDKDALRTDLGSYPEYLYDKNPFNDVQYVLNRDVMEEYCIPMIRDALKGKKGGHTDFDDYGYMTGTREDAGLAHILAEDPVERFEIPEQEGLTQEERTLVVSNVMQNVIETARSHPETTFIYYIAPYSAFWWGLRAQEGNLLKYIEAEETAASLMTKESNIELFDFADLSQITMDNNNYYDAIHFGNWIFPELLLWFREKKYLLTAENYSDYIEEQKALYMDFDYNELLSK